MEDEDYFNSALTDEAPEIEQPEPEQAPEPEADPGQPRDEHGRFATKQPTDPEPAPQTTAEQPAAQTEAHVPSFRLREEREARERVERQFQESQRDWQRQITELQSRLPKAEPAQRPDIFENPDGFVQQGVQQAVDPIKTEISTLKEFYSERDASREHGAEKVTAAKQALEQGMSRNDPDAWATYNRAMKSMHPYGEIVSWHGQKAVLQQVGNDPNAWFEKELERRMGDQQFAGSIMQKAQQSRQPGAPQATNTIKLPPSLNKIPAAQSSTDDDDGDVSDAAMFRHATR